MADDPYNQGQFTGNDTGIYSNGNGSQVSDNLDDYLSWDWKQIKAAVNGFAASTDADAQLAAARNVDPSTLHYASKAFQHAHDTMSQVSTNLLAQADALAGENGPWKGTGATAFHDKMRALSDLISANAERIAGGDSAGPTDSVPSQLHHSGNYLAWAQSKLQEIDLAWAAYARALGAPVVNGLTYVSQTPGHPEIPQKITEHMRKVMSILVERYRVTFSAVQVPDTVNSSPNPNSNNPPNPPEIDGNGNGPEIDGNGPGIDGNGPGIDGNGPSIDGDGPGIDGSGPGIDANAPGLDGLGDGIGSADIGDAPGLDTGDIPGLSSPDGSGLGGSDLGGSGIGEPNIPIDSNLPGFEEPGLGIGSDIPPLSGFTPPGLGSGLGSGLGLGKSKTPGLGNAKAPELDPAAGVPEPDSGVLPPGASVDAPDGLGSGLGSGIPPISPGGAPQGASSPERPDASGLLGGVEEPWDTAGVGDPTAGAERVGVAPGAGLGSGIPPISPGSAPQGASSPERPDASGLLGGVEEPWDTAGVGDPTAGAERVGLTPAAGVPPIAPGSAPQGATSPERPEASELLGQTDEPWLTADADDVPAVAVGGLMQAGPPQAAAGPQTSDRAQDKGPGKALDKALDKGPGKGPDKPQDKPQDEAAGTPRALPGMDDVAVVSSAPDRGPSAGPVPTARDPFADFPSAGNPTLPPAAVAVTTGSDTPVMTTADVVPESGTTVPSGEPAQAATEPPQTTEPPQATTPSRTTALPPQVMAPWPGAIGVAGQQSRERATSSNEPETGEAAEETPDVDNDVVPLVRRGDEQEDTTGWGAVAGWLSALDDGYAEDTADDDPDDDGGDDPPPGPPHNGQDGDFVKRPEPAADSGIETWGAGFLGGPSRPDDGQPQAYLRSELATWRPARPDAERPASDDPAEVGTLGCAAYDLTEEQLAKYHAARKATGNGSGELDAELEEQAEPDDETAERSAADLLRQDEDAWGSVHAAPGVIG
ncbi:hypothetical protein ABZ807_19400 [Micromonospora sp. NPDC047548]|uniref:WXG100 family type VII secretion target n=1 Tax=Micromonospora sp. NPDC047548 TaxID=3155624 RepID=UPI0033DB9105